MAKKESTGEKMVQVVLERHIPQLGAAGMAITVTASVAKTLTEYRNVHNGTHLVKARSARPFDEKQDMPIVGNMTVSEMRQAGLKNHVAVPNTSQWQGPSAAAANFQAPAPAAGPDKSKDTQPKKTPGASKKTKKSADKSKDKNDAAAGETDGGEGAGEEQDAS